MITLMLINWLDLNSWCLLGLVLEYFIGAYLVAAVDWLFKVKIFKTNTVIDLVSLRNFLGLPITAPAEIFIKEGIVTGVLTSFVVAIFYLCSPIMVVVIFVFSLGEWSGRRYEKRRQGA